MSEALFPDSPDTSAAAIVRDHAFEPRRTVAVGKQLGGEALPWVDLPPNEWLCQVCRLAEAAHTR
jgi:hypothetical protein